MVLLQQSRAVCRLREPCGTSEDLGIDCFLAAMRAELRASTVRPCTATAASDCTASSSTQRGQTQSCPRRDERSYGGGSNERWTYRFDRLLLRAGVGRSGG